MALIDDVKKICTRLASKGWHGLLLRHGLDIKASDLASELSRPLVVDRGQAGFQDFSNEGERGITPGEPARSLLYHALASPDVVNDHTGKPLRAFPTLAEIETVENYVYAATTRTLNDVLSLPPSGSNVAIAVFALEYRSKPGTPHQAHADLCFSRTGIARVGTSGQHYVPESRSFVSIADGDSSNAVRVRPARYAAYIAVQLSGDQNSFGPARFDMGRTFGQSVGSDGSRDFWVPLHKLFAGPECLTGRNLTVNYEAQHSNEKLRRIHMAKMGRPGHDTGHSGAKLDSHPFRFHERIADISTDAGAPDCLVVPQAHALLVEEATDASGRRISTRVPATPAANQSFEPTFFIPPTSTGARNAPEYVHVRDRVLTSGVIRHLNERRNVANVVLGGGYKALHYQDFAGDGWVRATCSQIGARVPRNIPAYSVVAAPDFYPLVGQGELMDWWRSSATSAFRDSIWSQVLPLSLSDQRTPPNLSANETAPGTFLADDTSVTAIISHTGDGSPRTNTSSNSDAVPRESHLPDYAAGVFAPGWDTSLSSDSTGTEHLAGYGLGSPFPEDAKLCAALSTFWPAAAPDSSRQYAPRFPLVCPLTDEEVGLGSLPSWDGNTGPRVVTRSTGAKVVEYTRFEYVDYVANALEGEISLAATSKLTLDDFVARILAMHRAYQAVGLSLPASSADVPRWNGERGQWGLISFSRVSNADSVVVEAARDGHSLSGAIFHFHMYRAGSSLQHPTDFKKQHVQIVREEQVLVDSQPRALILDGSGRWQRKFVV